MLEMWPFKTSGLQIVTNILLYFTKPYSLELMPDTEDMYITAMAT